MDERLRIGKRDLRASRRAMTLREKVEQVIELQKIETGIIRQRRELSSRERVWCN